MAETVEQKFSALKEFRTEKSQKIIKNLTARYNRSFPGHWDDLYQQACLGFWVGLQQWKDTGNALPITYGYILARRYILQYIATAATILKIPKTPKIQALRANASRIHSARDALEKYHVTEKEYAALVSAGHVFSLQTGGNDDQGIDIPSVGNQEKEYRVKQLYQLLNAITEKKFPKKNKTVYKVALMMLQGASSGEIQRTLDISRQAYAQHKDVIFATWRKALCALGEM
jgi:DNA-directed RNA polymerase specialized sigma subunit